MPLLSFPNTLANDTLADADQVMANLNAIRTLVNGQLDSANIAAGALVTTLFADESVTSAKILNGTIATGDLADDAVTAAKIATDAVGSSEIAADAVGTAEIATDAVTAAEIAAGAVGTPELADDAVTAAKIAADAVGTSEIATDAVTAAELAPNAVNTAELVNLAVTNAKLNLSLSAGEQSTAGIDLPDGAWEDCVSMTPIAATFLCIGILVAEKTNAGNNGFFARLTGGTGLLAANPNAANDLSGNLMRASAVVVDVRIFDGATALKLQGQKILSGDGSSAVKSRGTLDGGYGTLGASRIIICRIG